MVRNMKRFLMVAAVAIFAFAPSARADFNIQIFTDAALTNLIYAIDDDGPGDSSTPNLGVIGTSLQADLDTLNGAIAATGLQFTSLSAASNAGSPPADEVASLSVEGRVEVLGGFTAGELYILVSANDYTFPAGPSYLVGSQATHNFRGVDAAPATSPSFISYFNDSNTLNATETATGLLVFAPPAGDSVSGAQSPDLITAGSPSYGLTSVTRIRLSGAGASDQFTGLTTVRAVPEPGSLALIALGGSALVFGHLRRRKAQA